MALASHFVQMEIGLTMHCLITGRQSKASESHQSNANQLMKDPHY